MSYSPRRKDLRIRPVDEDATKVFVGGLNFQTEPDVLEDHFSKFGRLRKAEIIRDPDGRSKGFGFLYYEEESSAADAIEKGHNMEIEGRPVTVSRALARIPNDRRPADRYDDRRDDHRSSGRYDDRYEPREFKPRVGYRIAISGMPDSTDWMELKDMLRQAGKVTYANVARPGYGVGEFETLEECDEAVRIFDGSKLHDATITLKPLNYDRDGNKIPLTECDARFQGTYAPNKPQGGSGGGGRDYDRGGRDYDRGGRDDRGGGYSRPSGGYDRNGGGRGGYDRGYDSRSGGYESRGGGGYDRGSDRSYDRGGYESRGGGSSYERSGGYESRGGGGGGYDRGYDRGGSGYESRGGGGSYDRGSGRDYERGGSGPDRGYSSGQRSAPYDRSARY